MKIERLSGAKDAAEFMRHFSADLATLSLPLKIDRELFVMKDDAGKAVARMGASVSRTDGARGYIGYLGFDAHSLAHELSSHRALVGMACDWLKAKGVKTVYGPVNDSTWFTYRFFDHARSDSIEAPFSWEPQQPEEWLAFLKASGFTEAEHYHSLGVKSEGIEPLTMSLAVLKPAHDELTKAGFRFERIEYPVQDPSRLAAALKVVYDLSSEAFGENTLFEGIDYPVFQAVYQAVAARVNFSPSFLAYSPQGEAIGFSFCFFDRGYLVLKSLAVKEKYRKLKVSSALSYLSSHEAFENRVTSAIMALMRTGNDVRFHEERHRSLGYATWRHEYVLLKKDLNPAK